ncbi:hypothetical protein Tco_0655003 [Tanacetum coccineum]|uniref:Uncharacterized protein n=1 Tax=Tanacetum coccineum TaxID=301880 RepID=A0ABQ4X4W7_9ASTR
MVKECTKVIYEEKVRKKESISKQGRKNAKSKPTLDAFDDLDADLIHRYDADDRLFAAKFLTEEREDTQIEERAKFLAENNRKVTKKFRTATKSSCRE